MTSALLMLAVFFIGILVAIFIVPLLVSFTVRTILTRANQSMAYHNMTGRQIQALINEAMPAVGRFLTVRGGQLTASAVRQRQAWQIRNVVEDQSLDQLAADKDIQVQFALTAADIVALCAKADAAAYMLQTKGPAHYYPVAPPIGPVHLPAEHQAMRGALVHWPTGYPTQWHHHAQLISHILRGGEAHIVVRDEIWGQLVLSYLTIRGVEIMQVKLIIAPIDDLWVRDSGPTLIKTPAGMAAVANVYVPNGLGYHRRDTEAAIAVAQAWNHEVYRLPLIVEGGNLVTDGNGTFFMCDSIFGHNPDIDRARLDDIMLRWFGITQIIILPTLPGDITGHADIIVKVAEPGVLLVTQAPSRHRWHAALEEAVRVITQSSTVDGKPWQIIRMPMPGGKEEWTYVNALTVNGIIVAPSYDDQSDRAALDCFNLASPGREVCWVDYRAFMVGAVHCQTKEIPA